MNFQLNERIDFMNSSLKESGAEGFVVGNSGGKDCALVLAIAKRATDKVLAVAMPCESNRNFGLDLDHAKLVAEWLRLENIEIDLTAVKSELKSRVLPYAGVRNQMAYHNINPRLRMAALYTLAAAKNYLVLGTGNLSEFVMGYFTKWGDGAYDLNPIADLTALEVLEFLRELGAPREIVEKAPSAGLFDGQTDELDMGVTYKEIDEYIHAKRECRAPALPKETYDKIKRAYEVTRHKRELPKRFSNSNQF